MLTAGPGLAIAAPPDAAPGATARLSSCRWLAWTSPVGLVVRACDDVGRVGWLARQAIICVGEEAGRA